MSGQETRESIAARLRVDNRAVRLVDVAVLLASEPRAFPTPEIIERLGMSQGSIHSAIQTMRAKHGVEIESRRAIGYRLVSLPEPPAPEEKLTTFELGRCRLCSRRAVYRATNRMVARDEAGRDGWEKGHEGRRCPTCALEAAGRVAEREAKRARLEEWISTDGHIAEAGKVVEVTAPAEPRVFAPVEVGCVHHWRVDPPSGPFSLATCRRCGGEKEMPNSDGAAAERAGRTWGGFEDFSLSTFQGAGKKARI